jgi:hypothetical protein
MKEIEDHIAYEICPFRKRTTLEKEKEIAQNGQLSYLYALRSLRKRFPEGESVIIRDGYYIMYASHVIKGRWPEAEAIIKTAENAYYYAKLVINLEHTGIRFPEGELTISKSAKYSVMYAKLIESRFELGELAIAKSKNKKLIQDYSIFLLPESEIAKNAKLSYQYALFVLKGKRFFLGEPTIQKNNTWNYNYANYIIKGRWPEIESILVKNVDHLMHYFRGALKRKKYPFIENAILKYPELYKEYLETAQN